MPQRLLHALKAKVPAMCATSARRHGSTTVTIDGYMGDLPKDQAGFSLIHSEDHTGFMATVRAPDTHHGKQALERFKGAFGEGSEMPKIVHTGDGVMGYEFWSPSVHDRIRPIKEMMVKSKGRAIVEKNYPRN